MLGIARNKRRIHQSQSINALLTTTDMKKIIPVFYLAMLFATQPFAQEWAPVGAKWVYDVSPGMPPYLTVIESVGDTVILDKPCRKLVTTMIFENMNPDGTFNWDSEVISIDFVYSTSDTLFHFDKWENSFYPLYIMNLKAGDRVVVREGGENCPEDQYFCSRFEYVVDSTSTITLNDQERRALYNTPVPDSEWMFHHSWNSENYPIIEGIGSLKYFWGVNKALTMEGMVQNLRCYTDDNIQYKADHWSEDCDYFRPLSPPQTIGTFIKPAWTRVHNPEVTQPHSDNKSSYVSSDVLGDSLLLITGYVNKASCSYNSLLAYNLDGELLWSKDGRELLMHNIGGFYDLVKVSGSHIYTAGMGLVDDVGGYAPFAISKIDATGTIVFQEVYLKEGEELFFIPGSLDVSEDHGIILVSDPSYDHYAGQVMKASTDGKIAWIKQYHSTTMQAGFTPSGFIALLSEEAISLINNDGEVTTEMTFDIAPVGMHIRADGIYILFSHRLLHVDFDLQEPKWLIVNYPNQFKSIRGFDNEIWLQAVVMDTKVLHLLKESGIAETFSMDRILENPDFLIIDEQIFLTGTSPSGQIALSGYFKNKQVPDYSWPDMELVDFDISNVSYNYLSQENVGFVTDFDLDASLTIRNNGAKPLNSLSVFSPRSGGFNCTNQFYYRTFDNLSLQPGTELVIEFGRSNEFSPPRINHEICFEILAPDNLIEINVQSNSLCKSFNIANVKNPAFWDDNTIFPNPAHSRIYFKDVSPEILRAELADITGRVVSVITDPDLQDHFALDSLPNGLYIVRFMSARKIVTRKFIKSE
jgi:hypothetical protein